MLVVTCFKHVSGYETEATVYRIDSEQQGWVHIDKCPYAHEMKRSLPRGKRVKRIAT